MYKVAILYTGPSYEKALNAIRLQELLGQITVIGIGCQNIEAKKIDGYSVYSVEEILKLENEWEYLLVGGQGENFTNIKDILVTLGVEKDKIFSIDIFLLPMFDFKRYVEVMGKGISIISNHCWGGFTYHSLKSEFLSPFINLFVLQDEYIKLLEHFDECMEDDVVYLEDAWASNQKREYPVGILKKTGIKIHFNHYKTFDEAKKKWEERKKRINRDELFVEISTDSEQLLKRFDILPFKKKIAFVPFETDIQSAISLREFRDVEEKGICGLVNNLGAELTGYYDLLKLLNWERDFCRIG